MAQNTKTPAMALQEFTVKAGYPPPEYILTLSKTGTHDNEFHYKVVVAGTTGKGYGHSKQVAKHAAASDALENLAQEGVYDPKTNPTQCFNPQSHRNESDDIMKPIVNHIGSLKNMCIEFKLPVPIFNEISDVGPPHCRVFTYECRMSSIVTQATANTKKQAKQLAAKDMVDKVKDICPELAEEFSNSLTETEHENVIKKYTELTNNVIPNKAIKMIYHTHTIKNLMIEMGLVFEDFHEEFETKNWENFSKILEKLELKHSILMLMTEPKFMLILTIHIETPFSVMGVGTDEESAREDSVIAAYRVLEAYMNINLDDHIIE